MKNLQSFIKKPPNFYIKTNLLENRYITNSNIWTVDETIFNDETKLFLVVALKTRAILGFILASKPITEDIIIELYEQILDDYQFKHTPVIIHSDMEETYHSQAILKWFEEFNIQVSVTKGFKNQNQVSESINNRIKYLVAKLLISDPNAKTYRAFNKSLPDKLKNINKLTSKSQDKEYRKHLFQSKHFKCHRNEVIYQAILEYNKTPYIDDISREEAQYYDSFIKAPSIEDSHLVDSNHVFANIIKHENVTNIKQVQGEVLKILNEDIESEEKVGQILSLVFERQDNTDSLLKKGFLGIYSQIYSQNTELQRKLDEQKKQTEIISKQLEEVLKQQELAEEKRQKRRNRKRLPPRNSLTEEMYHQLIQKVDLKYRDSYQGVRLRLALALLAVTGVRISELLPLTVRQIQPIFTKSWIAIDRLKRGPSNHKAFLTPKGVRIMAQRAKDFEIISYLKKDDDFVFTPENKNKPLSRQAFNRLINGFIKEFSQELDNKPNLKSYSFRIGFITELWKDTKDIEFVRQSIGHARVDTTSKYVQNLSEEERRIRMINIQDKNDLFYKSDD